jgi:putative DNA primase/helicase
MNPIEQMKTTEQKTEEQLIAEIRAKRADKKKAKEPSPHENGKPAQEKQTKKAGSQPTQVGVTRFNLTDSAVWATDEDGNKTWVCSSLIIEADTRDENSENWGRLLKFSDRDGVNHTWAMPMCLLSRDGAEYREYLLNLGLVIAPGRKSRTLLETYLNTKPEKKVFCVTKQGWHRGAFVLPDTTIGETAEPVYLQTVATNHLFRHSGTVDEWREQIGRFCAGNKRLLLAVSIAFSAPLLEPLQAENGGWHFTGQSSTGKTTALFVAGSVHGGGGDKGYIRRWRATINGLETVAESHHDALLCLDEIVECRPDDVNEAAYMLANGQGKARQSRGGALRRTLEWRLVFLSSGEISIADHVAQTGKRVRAGQEVRVINLPADAGAGMGLFEELHGFNSPDEFSRHLQRSSKDYYGAPIREFLRRITSDLDTLRAEYRTFESELLAEMLPENAASEVSRVAHRFALTAFAGEMATKYGITGWEPDEATEAAKALFQSWIEARGTSGSVDEEAAIRQIKIFIEQHGHSRFQRLFTKINATDEDGFNVEDRTVINRAGYVRPESGSIHAFYILTETFRKEVCKGFNPKMVVEALEKRGLLISNGKSNQYQIRIPEGRVWVYAVKSEILEK